MIEVENDYESVTYEHSFHSQIYENHLELPKIITLDLEVITYQ